MRIYMTTDKTTDPRDDGDIVFVILNAFMITNKTALYKNKSKMINA